MSRSHLTSWHDHSRFEFGLCEFDSIPPLFSFPSSCSDHFLRTTHFPRRLAFKPNELSSSWRRPFLSRLLNFHRFSPPANMESESGTQFSRNRYSTKFRRKSRFWIPLSNGETYANAIMFCIRDFCIILRWIAELYCWNYFLWCVLLARRKVQI